MSNPDTPAPGYQDTPRTEGEADTGDFLDQRFDTFGEWVNYAPSWLTSHAEYDASNFRAICFDAKGRRCAIGGDFMRARDEDAFPVRWLWPDQIGPMALRATAPA